MRSEGHRHTARSIPRQIDMGLKNNIRIRPLAYANVDVSVGPGAEACKEFLRGMSVGW